eukprot:TRINITY_DN1846_c0_g1_i2.p1 TRINITY_DN1846_c0_g1~~TRINITY_DN1846_c0_g1_i2.p1  ORF type:complete len:636 (+),score=96.98 TRINITY_DN1846_c0_g1_i2:88-1995(+)
MPRGTVSKVNADKGFGFIQPEDSQGGQGHFYHITNVSHGGKWLQVGCVVDYELTQNTQPGHEGKMQATDVRLVSGGATPSPPATRVEPKKQCFHWRRGRCQHGDLCQFLHPRKACVDFLDGSCKRGEYCTFRHTDRSPPRGAQPKALSEIKDWDVYYFWDARNVLLTRGDDISEILADMNDKVAQLVTPEGCRWNWRCATADKRYYYHDGTVPPQYKVPPGKLRDLTVDGWTHIDPGPKKDADDHKMISDIGDLVLRCQRFVSDPGSGGVDPSRAVVVVVTGDRDCSGALRKLLQDGKVSRTVLVYGEPVNQALVKVVEHAIRWGSLRGVAGRPPSPPRQSTPTGPPAPAIKDSAKIFLKGIPEHMPDRDVLALLKTVGTVAASQRNNRTSMKVTMQTKEQAAAALALSGKHGIQIMFDKYPDGWNTRPQDGVGGSAGKGHGAGGNGNGGKGAAPARGSQSAGYSGGKAQGGACSAAPHVDSDTDKQLYLKFIPLTWTEADVRQFLRGAGDVRMCKVLAPVEGRKTTVARAEMATAAGAELAVKSLQPPPGAPDLFVEYQRVTDLQPGIRRLVAMGYERTDVERAIAEAHGKGHSGKAALTYATEILPPVGTDEQPLPHKSEPPPHKRKSHCTIA